MLSFFSFAEQFPALQPFIKWCAATGMGRYIADTVWAFKFIETIHILAFVVLLGTTLLVNLRVLGILRGWSSAQLARTLSRFIYTSLIAVIATGILMFLSDPWKYYGSLAFGPKLTYLALAIAYQIALFPRMIATEAAWARVGAALSIAAWFLVGAAGRWIAFV